MKNFDRIAIGIIIAMMVMKTSLTKIFAKFIPIFNLSYDPPILSILYVLMIMAAILLVCVPRMITGKRDVSLRSLWDGYSFLIAELVILAHAIIMTDIVTIANGQLRISNVLTHNLDYMYAFLALPITILLVEKKWKFEDFADVLLAISFASMLLRLFVVIINGATGIEIECISRESTFEGWIRNGRIRIVPPCFIMLCEPVCIYMFNQVKEVGKKLWYLLVLGMTIFYAYFVWQSRMAILFIMGGIVVMLLFKQMSKKSAYIRWGIVGAGAVLLIIAGGAIKLISMFSTNENAKYIGENRGHYYAYDVFWGQIKMSPIFGTGLTEQMAMKSNYIGMQWLCDAGIMYSIVPMGIMIVLFFFLMFSRGIYVYIKGYSSSKLAVVALALATVFMGFELSADCFFTPLAFVVPFYLAIVEYSNSQAMADE